MGLKTVGFEACPPTTVFCLVVMPSADLEGLLSPDTGLPAGWTKADVLAKLPPLPRPDVDRQRGQYAKGWGITTLYAALCLLATWYGNYLLDGIAPDWYLNFVTRAIAVELVVAYISLILIWFLPDGKLERTMENAFPLPEAVAEKLVKGEPLIFDTNIHDQDIGKYCVRCFLWRRKDHKNRRVDTGAVTLFYASNRFHHCSVCNRCVFHFDNHCENGGRCVAGDGFGGTLGAFRILTFQGTLGPATAALVLFPGLWYTEYGRYFSYLYITAINFLLFFYYSSLFDHLAFLCGKPNKKGNTSDSVFTEWFLGETQIWKSKA